MTETAIEFHWFSLLGVSVVLFMLHGILYLLIGLVWPFASDWESNRRILIMSPRTDTTVFGDTPENINNNNAQLRMFRSITFTIFSGIMVAAGIMIIAVAWYGLRKGYGWSLGSLTLTGLAVLPYWWLVLRVYWKAGAALTLGDIPPFMWIPASLLLPAVILGLAGLR